MYNVAMTERSNSLDWYYAHRDAELERMREWRRKNAEARSAYGRAYREGRPEQHRKWGKAWRDANPERQEQIAAAQNANARASRAGVPGKLSADDVAALWVRQPVCVGCGSGHGVDHITPIRLGGENVPANLQNLCRVCNSAKNARTQPRVSGRMTR